MLYPLKIPPGIYRNGTDYQAKGRWNYASLTRFFEGTIRPVGGWRSPTTTVLNGIARGLFPWRDFAQNRWAAIGTNTNLYAYSGGSIYNITPVGFSPGRADAFAGIGYGYGAYSLGTAYGVAPTDAGALDIMTWSFDNWGENLVGVAAGDGHIYEWAPRGGALPHVVANSPASTRALTVSAERYLFALGSGQNPRLVQWCDQENNTVWTPTATNTAGDIELQTNGKIQCARRIHDEVIVWTDTDLHAMPYVGPPLVYGRRRVGDFCGVVGPNAVAVVEFGAVWMSTGAFYKYDGALSSIPCEVSDYVFSDINQVQRSKTYAGRNNRFGEVWWFYPSSASSEVNRYVVWNYRENHWNVGALTRTAWADSGVFTYPLGVDATGHLFEHENGFTNDGAPITFNRFLQSGPVEIDDGGNRVVSVVQVVPDEASQGHVSLTFGTRFTPESTRYDYGPYTLTPYTDVRFTGRQVSMTIAGVGDDDWRVGTIRFDGTAGGRR